MMLDLNILGHILPEVANMHGVPQPPEFHPEGNVWQHTLLMFQHMRWRTPALAWSCLLHDVGKPPTYIVEDRIRFPKHALESARMSSDILTRMHASRQLIDTVTQATKNHMKFADVLNMKNSTILNMIDAPTFPVELELHRLDCISSHRKLDCYLKLVDKLVELKDKPPVPPPLITGNDLLTLGIPEGPVIGRILKSVQEKTLNGEISTREEALATACQEKDAILE
jgi:poly(A) polymerase